MSGYCDAFMNILFKCELICFAAFLNIGRGIVERKFLKIKVKFIED